jgi:hypothetical protein
MQIYKNLLYISHSHILCIKKCILFLLVDVPVVEPQLSPGLIAYNPYPSLGAPDSPCWPRGFPMDQVQNALAWTDDLSNVTNNNNAEDQFGILQSLADFQPDVDAMYRLTHKTPFVFKRPPTTKIRPISDSK